ncbi:MAG: F0F1 ATP synthase subunit A [Oscillospiraceae bacterium]|nr:F0F1 ATP synthase subunit A [Oscillospiraceae bacterium]
MEEASNVLFSIGPLEVSGSVVTMWFMMLVVTLLSILATRNMKDVPGKLQNVAEMAVGGLRNYFTGTLGKELCEKYFPVFATFFIFIIVSNYSGLLPGAGHFRVFHVPTANLSVTVGLAVIAFFTTHIIGIREKGFKKYFIGMLTSMTIPLFFLAIIEQVVRPFSLALRLYGNLYGEEAVTENLYSIFPVVVPLVMQILSILFCLIQVLVFTMLLSIYVREAAEKEE